MRRFSCISVIVFAAIASRIIAAAAPNSQVSDPIVEQAKQLVHDALRAEADGNADLRAADLKQALSLAPDLSEAHWQSGEVRRGSHWLTTTDAENEASTSAKMAEYRKLQEQAALTVDDQLKIARWCDKNGLDEEEKAHARVALQFDPNQEEAMRRLSLVKFRGQIISKSQFDETKSEYQQALADSKEWRTRLWKLRRQYERDPVSRNETLSQIRSITDIRAIPAIEAVFSTADAEPAIAAVEALTAMESSSATQSLIRFAVLADPTTVRYAAATALKGRDIYSTVPTLLAHMQGPIQAAYLNLGMEGNTAVSRFTFVQENSESYRVDTNYELVNYTGVDSQHGVGHGFTLPATEEPRMKARVDAANRTNAQLNRRIALVLATVTDQKLDDDPKSWWNWWYGQNDYYQPPEKPLDWYSSESTVTQSAPLIPNAPVPFYPFGRRSSCFVAGTPVWTTTGPMPIEMIRAGELVLSQNYETGELAYKPVLATTVRPEGPTLQTRAGGTFVRSTRGHPFWVDGIGWQMAKELKAGERLHTINGAVSNEEVTDGDPADCFNLVVADFNTYFVGDAKLLVHDNTLRGPTTAIVPGLLGP